MHVNIARVKYLKADAPRFEVSPLVEGFRKVGRAAVSLVA